MKYHVEILDWHVQGRRKWRWEWAVAPLSWTPVAQWTLTAWQETLTTSGPAKPRRVMWVDDVHRPWHWRSVGLWYGTEPKEGRPAMSWLTSCLQSQGDRHLIPFHYGRSCSSASSQSTVCIFVRLFLSSYVGGMYSLLPCHTGVFHYAFTFKRNVFCAFFFPL